MSPSPVPTSSSVASRGTSFNASLTSSRAELIPPNRALARATSASERVTIRGSTSGESSISTPLLRGGVSMSRTALMLQLCVTAAVVEERRPALHACRFHFAKDDSVVASIVQGEPAALQHPEYVVENRVSIRRRTRGAGVPPVRPARWRRPHYHPWRSGSDTRGERVAAALLPRRLRTVGALARCVTY